MDVSKLDVACYINSGLSDQKTYKIGLQVYDQYLTEIEEFIPLVTMEEGDDFQRSCDWAITELEDAIERIKLLKLQKNPAQAKVQEKINDKKFQNKPAYMLPTTKPKPLKVWEGSAECVSENYDDMGGGAFCVTVDCSSIYDSKNVGLLINWLQKAKIWLERKEQYLPPGRKPKNKK